MIEAERRPSPRAVYIEVTNRCNSRCQTCIRSFHDREPARDLSYGEFEAILEQFPAVERLVLHGVGEPLLNADLQAMIARAKARRPSPTVLFNSNAILLDEGRQEALMAAGLDELRVSLDAATAATYAAVRGVDAFHLVAAQTRQFAGRLAARGQTRPRLSLWCMALRENLAELPALVDLAADSGVGEVYVQRLVYFGEGLAQVEQSLYRRLRESEERALAEASRRAERRGVSLRASGATTPAHSLGAQDTARPWAGCRRLWTSTYITANGNVLPCCIAPFSASDYAGLILGNVFETPFAQIWEGAAYVRRRASLDTDAPLHPCELCGDRWSL